MSRRFIRNCILSSASGNLLQRLPEIDSVFDSHIIGSFEVRIHTHTCHIKKHSKFLDMLLKVAYVCECVLRSSKQIKLYVFFEAEIMNNMYRCIHNITPIYHIVCACARVCVRVR